MTATNHSLTGASIGLLIVNPLVALPLALLSHFVLDGLPHFGFSKLNDRSWRFNVMLVSDIILCGLLVLMLIATDNPNWIIASICAFIAASPDFMWMPGYIRQLKGKAFKKEGNIIMNFHSFIQWYQKPKGALVEVAYFVFIVTTLVKLLKIW